MAMVADTIQVLARAENGSEDQVIQLIGANHKMIRCNVFVVSEQITPMMHSNPMETNTVCSAVLVGR